MNTHTGLELTATAAVVRSDRIFWSWTANLHSTRNMVLALGAGVQPFLNGDGSRVAPGYPLGGIWARPIIGYYDANHDGVIEQSEVRLGDTAVYLGTNYPKYEVGLSTQLSLFDRALSASATFVYQNGLTQVNGAFHGSTGLFFYPGLTDPSAPLGEQAAAAAAGLTDYGLIASVSTLRFNSLAIAYTFPRSFARAIGADAVSLQLQGTNLGLWSTYRGKDPDVSGNPIGNMMLDTGVLPTPRTWFVSVRAAY